SFDSGFYRGDRGRSHGRRDAVGNPPKLAVGCTWLFVALVLALAGCGGEHTHGTATLWVTRDRGAHVLFEGDVPAGLTAMQALVRVQKVSTRYGGHFVQSIDGVSGSLSAEQDWFFFVNGVESSTGAAEV